MSILSVMGRAFLEGYAASELNVMTMFICMFFTALISLYVCFIYKMVNKNAFFNRGFHLALFALSVITASVILTIQSNIVVSLGMVGALSIVRFRTAIKDPMDLVFLFWSISVGIICGAGFAMIAVIGSIILSMGILLFSVLPAERESLILVVNLDQYNEDAVMDAVKQQCGMWKIRARNITGSNTNLAVEVKTSKAQELVMAVNGLPGVRSVSLVEHDGDVTV